jgi:hypothetical protein
LRIKSEPLLRDLTFKSEHLGTHNLRPKGGLRLWYSCTRDSPTTRLKELIERYLKKEIDRSYIQEVLGIGKTRFFALVKDYRTNANEFSIHYTRTTHTRTIPQEV